MSRAAEARIVELLTQSKIYRDYEKAFQEATQLPLSLNPPEYWNLAHHRSPKENPFCALMASSNRTCAACLDAQQQLHENPEEPQTVACFAGLCETSVPLRVGGKLVGFLQTGEVRLEQPTQQKFDRTARQLLEWGFSSDLRTAEEAWFQTRVLSRKQYESMVRLLVIFAEHLSLVANQIITQESLSEPPSITRARNYIASHQDEEISLPDVARAVNMSSYYFCKTFKKSTGLTFTEYLSRLRIEKAKNLLLNPNARVSEVAFETGFNSITNFNRKFRELVGQSPTTYRQALPRRA